MYSTILFGLPHYNCVRLHTGTYCCECIVWKICEKEICGKNISLHHTHGRYGYSWIQSHQFFACFALSLPWLCLGQKQGMVTEAVTTYHHLTSIGGVGLSEFIFDCFNTFFDKKLNVQDQKVHLQLQQSQDLKLDCFVAMALKN